MPISTLSNSVSNVMTKENFIVAAKVLTVALVVAGLVTASIFSFGAAGATAAAAVGAASAGGTISSFAAAGALYGTGVGLVASAGTSIYIGSKCSMFEHTKENLKDTAMFLGFTTITTVVLTALCAASGANDGLKIGVGAAIILGASGKYS